MRGRHANRHANSHGDSAPESPGRRRALLLGSAEIAGAVLPGGKAAAGAIAPPAPERAGQPRAGSDRAQRITVNGLGIEYEIIGTGEPAVVTPGGRFSKDTPGVRELAAALAAAGKRVLICVAAACRRRSMLRSDLFDQRRVAPERPRSARE